MVKIDKKLEEGDYVRALGDLKALPEISTVEPIDGPCDFLVTAEAPIRMVFVAHKIQAREWVKGLGVPKVTPSAPVGSGQRRRTLMPVATG